MDLSAHGLMKCLLIRHRTIDALVLLMIWQGSCTAIHPAHALYYSETQHIMHCWVVADSMSSLIFEYAWSVQCCNVVIGNNSGFKWLLHIVFHAKI